MTLILTELSGAGIAMVADSAISISKDGKISTKDQRQWTKLLRAPHIGAGVSYWGAIGEITKNRRFDEWLERKIKNTDCYSDVRSLANYVAAEMNQSAGDKPIANPAGIHVAGFQPWADGVRRASLYHIHNGRSEPNIRSWSTEVNGQKVIVKREIDNSFEPRIKFERHNDFSPENPKSSDQMKVLDDPHKNHITSNGDYYAFTLIAEGIRNVFGQLNTITGVSVPRDPNKVGSHVGLLKVLMEVTIDIYRCSNMQQTIGGKISTLGIRPDGTYQV
jgi:hypothetical protein